MDLAGSDVERCAGVCVCTRVGVGMHVCGVVCGMHVCGVPCSFCRLNFCILHSSLKGSADEPPHFSFFLSLSPPGAGVMRFCRGVVSDFAGVLGVISASGGCDVCVWGCVLSSAFGGVVTVGEPLAALALMLN